MKAFLNVLTVFLIWAFLYGTGAAQEPSAPDSPVVKEYRQFCARHNIECSFSQQQSLPDLEPPPALSAPAIDGFAAIIVVVVVFVGALLLWAWFGGAGILLARAPKEMAGEKPESARNSIQALNSKSKVDVGPDALAQIANMADKRAALVELLRICLFHAAEVTDTRALRSDTERSMFARLPKRLPHHKDLAHILRETELAHYGGRAVPQERFEELLDAARRLLKTRSVDI